MRLGDWFPCWGRVFFRRKSLPSGVCWQLLESFRNEEGQPRQRVVASLGDAPLPERELKAMAKTLERKLKDPNDLFAGKWEPAPLSPGACWWVDRIYRQVVRDGRYCQVRRVSDTGRLPQTSSPSSPSSGISLGEVRIEEIGHEHSALLGPLLPGKA